MQHACTSAEGPRTTTAPCNQIARMAPQRRRWGLCGCMCAIEPKSGSVTGLHIVVEYMGGAWRLHLYGTAGTGGERDDDRDLDETRSTRYSWLLTVTHAGTLAPVRLSEADPKTFKVLGCHLCLGCHTHQLCGYKGTCSSNPGPVSGVSPQLEFDGGSNAIETCQQRGAEVFGGRQLQLMHVRTRSLMFRRVGGVAL
jgi:hypothetical protein